MSRLIHFFSFLIFYIWEVLQSNFQVAHDVLSPTHRMNPGIIAMDVTGMTDQQLLLISNFITMTPGTLGLAFSEDRKKLYIHAMFLGDDYEAVSKDLENTYGKRVRRVF